MTAYTADSCKALHRSSYRKHLRNRRAERNSGRQINTAGIPGILYSYLPGLAAVLLILFLTAGPLASFFSGGAEVARANQQLSEIQYKVIEIHKGDSLWSIANDNMTPGFSDINAYIIEIKNFNQLESSSITSGSYLMIPYYEVESSDYAAR